MNTKSKQLPNDGLIAILKEKSDLSILQEQGWYRIPVKNAPKEWPPKWIGFYQPKNFGEDAYRIRYFGQIERISLAKRQDIFPNEIISDISNREYFILKLKNLEELGDPIPSFRPRRLVFIPTSWQKFCQAKQINDLFNTSPLEDLIWEELTKLPIDAERQWCVGINRLNYFLDFAIFCKNGRLNVETDGDFYHINPIKAPLDNARDNALQISGWTVLRYSTRQIKEGLQTECLRGIEASINTLGGLSSDGLVPRYFYTNGDHTQQQLNLFEADISPYTIEYLPESLE